VAAFYNRDKKTQRPGQGLRRLNNFIKTCLIQEAADEVGGEGGTEVACWACGVGGDAGKYAFVPSIRHVSFVDISWKSVNTAKTRVESNRRVAYTSDFATHDLSTPYEAGRKYDVIFCQFAVHYMFGSDEDLDTFCDNVTRHLKPGGRLVCTTTDERRVDAMRPAFENSLMKVRFDADETERYFFTLRGAVEDVPEYVVRIRRFDAAMQRAGAKARGRRNFEQLRVEYERRYAGVADRMLRGMRLGRDESTVFGIYAAHAFDKITPSG
jgi:mRNA (guanine-N7-)-methyltransferase